MSEPFVRRFQGERRLCIANLFLTTALFAAAGWISFWKGPRETGWLMVGCGVLLAAAYFAMGKLDAGPTPKALLSALCQPPAILFLLGDSEPKALLWVALSADLILTAAYFRIWVTLPQALLTDVLLILAYLWYPIEDILPAIAFQLMALAVLLVVCRGSASWKKYRLLSDEMEGFLNLFEDLYGRLQQGFDRTLVRLEQMTEQDGLLSECSACLGGGSEPVLAGVKSASQTLEQLLGKEENSQSQLLELQKGIQQAQTALEQNQRAVTQVEGIVRCHRGDIRAIQQDIRSLDHLIRSLQRDAIRPTNR